MKTLRNNLLCSIIIAISITTFAMPVSSQPGNAEISVTAAVISREYQENEARAERTYRGNTISVNGQVARIAETPDFRKSHGEIFVSLTDGSDLPIKEILCHFRNEAEIDKALELSRGDMTTITGIVMGVLYGDIILENCFISDYSAFTATPDARNPGNNANTAILMYDDSEFRSFNFGVDVPDFYPFTSYEYRHLNGNERYDRIEEAEWGVVYSYQNYDMNFDRIEEYCALLANLGFVDSDNGNYNARVWSKNGIGVLVWIELEPVPGSPSDEGIYAAGVSIFYDK